MIHERRSAIHQAMSSALNCRILEPVLVRLPAPEFSNCLGGRFRPSHCVSPCPDKLQRP